MKQFLQIPETELSKLARSLGAHYMDDDFVVFVGPSCDNEQNYLAFAVDKAGMHTGCAEDGKSQFRSVAMRYDQAGLDFIKGLLPKAKKLIDFFDKKNEGVEKNE